MVYGQVHNFTVYIIIFDFISLFYIHQFIYLDHWYGAHTHLSIDNHRTQLIKLFYSILMQMSVY